MASRNRARKTRPLRHGRRSGRSTVLILGFAVAIVMVFALVFSVAFGTRAIAGHASALHNADEALRSATIVRSQLGLATHLSVLERDFGFDAAEGSELSTSEVRLGLDDLDSSLEGLLRDNGDLDATIVTSARAFNATSIEILAALEDGDVETAQAIAGDDLDLAFRSFTGTLVVERDRQAAEVAAANTTMGQVGDLARFLVAFLVPTSVIILYREMSKRQQRQKELEVRLETEQELSKARDDFVANASHELRTPLTSILGMAHLLEEDPGIAAHEINGEMVGLIISEANDLSRMVDDLLTTARLDAGALHYQFENLTITDEIREVVGPIERSGPAIAVHAEEGTVRSDRLRLRQVIRNLLSNARKYGGPNIRVVGGHVNGWYEVRVEDDGQGIPEDLRQRLFQRYLHEGDMPIILGSVGLGLSIVRALAEGMGGAVWYERREGWTSFAVRIPLATDAEKSQYREAPPYGPSMPADPAPTQRPTVVSDEHALGSSPPIPSL